MATPGRSLGTLGGPAPAAGHSYAWHYLVWFIVIVLVGWVVLIAINPGFVQRDSKGHGHHGKHGCDDVDYGKAFVWALIIAVGICLLLWLVRSWAYPGAY